MRAKPLSRLAVVVIVALLGAPLAGWSPSTCDHCLPDCPMHAGARMHCHHGDTATSGPQAHPKGHCAATPGIARPGCGHGAQSPTVVVARAILPAPVPSWSPPPSVYHRGPESRSRGRDLDPPDSPPPILSA